ncbi:uncharacterized protein LOC111064661 [Drosophila obscura]|uniref:uncharacterized protein LOC111064661 n=1 Tax=Drosophila obscura TaxID=7282 RepID=UPI001BB220CD|nr:uncharacterized protein LOC111064661 [Drosophila obscura]
MKFTFTFLIYLWMNSVLCSELTADQIKQALEIDAIIKAEFENVKGFAYCNDEYKEYHAEMKTARKWGAKKNAKKLKVLHDYQRYNVERLALEKQLLGYCEEIQKAIRGKCHDTFRKLRIECVDTLTKSNKEKGEFIENLKALKCVLMIMDKSRDYHFGK